MSKPCETTGDKHVPRNNGRCCWPSLLLSFAWFRSDGTLTGVQKDGHAVVLSPGGLGSNVRLRRAVTRSLLRSNLLCVATRQPSGECSGCRIPHRVASSRGYLSRFHRLVVINDCARTGYGGTLEKSIMYASGASRPRWAQKYRGTMLL